MTWSISRSGPKAEVKKIVQEETFPYVSDPAEKREADAAKALVIAACDSPDATTHINVSASGSKGGNLNVHITRHVQTAENEPPKAG